MNLVLLSPHWLWLLLLLPLVPVVKAASRVPAHALLRAFIVADIGRYRAAGQHKGKYAAANPELVAIF